MINDSRPAYRVLDPNGFYADDTLYTVDGNGDPMEIYFDGIPNEQLEPLNEPARQRLTEYLNKLDELGRIAAEKAGRPYVGRPRSLDGAIELATAIQRNEMAIMGTKNKPVTTELVNPAPVAETGATLSPKRGRGRPRKDPVAA